jgi:hypothetical protein
MIRNLHQISLGEKSRIPLAEHAACAVEKKNIYRGLVRGIEKDHLEDQYVCRWEDVINVDLK